MLPIDIKHALERAGHSQADIARSVAPAVDRSLVNMVIGSKARSRRVEQRIAEIIGKPATEIWPHWYAEPRPNHRRKPMSVAEMFERIQALEARLAASKAA